MSDYAQAASHKFPADKTRPADIQPAHHNDKGDVTDWRVNFLYKLDIPERMEPLWHLHILLRSEEARGTYMLSDGDHPPTYHQTLMEARLAANIHPVFLP